MLNAKFSECKYYRYRDTYREPIFAGALANESKIDSTHSLLRK